MLIRILRGLVPSSSPTTPASQSLRMNRSLLTYSADGAHLTDGTGRISWNQNYEIQNMLPRVGVDLLVEVRLDPLPLIHDTDILPFDSLEPIEWLMQAAGDTKSGEIEAAQKMHSLAMNGLKARETTEATVQTPVIVNSLFPGSPGEVSMEAVNI